MIAARQIYLGRGGKTGWVNPYVTDGLVAMWDGEWNAGGGVHDPAATTWVDLSGNGQDFTLDLSHSEISSDCISFDGRGKVTPISTNFALSENLTLEIVAKRSVAFVSATTRPFFTFGQYIYWRGDGTNQGGPIGFTVYHTPTNSVQMYCVPNIDTTTRPVALGVVAIQNNENTQFLARAPWVNGSLATYSRVYGYGSARSSSASVGTTNTSDGVTSIYTVRVYNRNLTSEEFASNYAIDKDRFNLP